MMKQTVLDLRRTRLTWAALVALALVLPVLAMPTWTQAAPASVNRQSIAVLIVCSGKSSTQKAVEDRIVTLIRQAMSDQDLPKAALPILVYHYDKPSEAKYCQSTLHIGPNELPFLGLASHKDLVVKQVILREPNVTDPEASVGRLFTKAFKLITGTDLQMVTPTAPATRTPQPTPTETAEPDRPGGVRLGPVVTCRSIRRPVGEPVDTTDKFGPRDTVYVNFLAYNLKAGTTLHVRWYQGDTLMNVATITSPRAGNLYAFFHRTPAPTWAIGAYHADIYVDGKYKTRVYFRITDS